MRPTTLAIGVLLLLGLSVTDASGRQSPGAPATTTPGEAACAQAVADADAERYAKATEAARRCERALATAPTEMLRVDLEHVRGRLAASAGDYRVAIGHHQSALEIATRVGDRARMARAYDRLADLSVNTGDYAKHFEYAHRAFELTPHSDERTRGRFLWRIATTYAEIMDIERADAHYREAFTLAGKLGDTSLAVSTLNSWGMLYFRTDLDVPRARQLFQQGLDALAQRPDPRLLSAKAALLINYANTFRDDRATAAQSLPLYHEALALYRRTGTADGVPFSLKNMGRALRILGRDAEAEPILLEAIETAEISNVGRIKWQAPMELGTLLASRNPDRAERYYRAALDALEAQHSNVLLEGYRAGALSGDLSMYDNPYDLYVDLLLARGRPADAFLVAERERARAFLDTLVQARAPLATAIPADFVENERRVLQAISDQQTALRSGKLDAQARQAALATIDREEQKLDALRVRLAAQNPALAQARYPRLWSAADLRARLLSTNEAIVSFYLGANRSTAWILKKNDLAVVRLPGRREIAAAVTPVVDALKDPASDPATALDTLSQLVVTPLLGSLAGISRLIVLPAGALHYVPFETLRDPQGRFLVERFVIAYAPSASSYAYLREQPPVRATRIVAVGNPRLEASGNASDRAIALERVAWLKPLPHSHAEMEDVASIFPGAVAVLEQDAATEPALASASLNQAAIVHFATHALVDEANPERSGLALTAAPPLSDGILQTREIYKLKLNAALVMLSACETALGRALTGEGIVGLSRAFFFAGANAVMASLWSVGDASTAQLMTSFYEELRGGAPADLAMTAAKRRFLRDARLRHPTYWASFVVMGSAATPIHVPVQTRWSARVASVTLLGLAAAGFAVARVTARRRRARAAGI